MGQGLMGWKHRNALGRPALARALSALFSYSPPPSSKLFSSASRISLRRPGLGARRFGRTARPKRLRTNTIPYPIDSIDVVAKGKNDALEKISGF
jgi:hypothetical protein